MPKVLKKKAFSYKEVLRAGLGQHDLIKLIKQGLIEKTGYGQYRDASLLHEPEADYQMAIKVTGSPATICLLSALAYYDLTDSIPKKVWVLVPQEVRRRHPRLRLVRKRNPQWDIGIVEKSGYAITTIERSIVESLTLHRLIGKNEALAALKRALKNKKTSIPKIYNVARAMEVDKRIQSYLEALSP